MSTRPVITLSAYGTAEQLQWRTGSIVDGVESRVSIVSDSKCMANEVTNSDASIS